MFPHLQIATSGIRARLKERSQQMRPKTAEDALDLVKEQQRGEIVVVESEGLLSKITVVERA